MQLELQAVSLRQADFPEEALKCFIQSVCRWGRRAGIATLVINNNAPLLIRQQFQRAIDGLNNVNLVTALSEINRIRYLGRPSFASKHLRFLRPEICPILDSLVSRNLFYDYTREGYQQLSGDYGILIRALQLNGIGNPINREGGNWFAADIDMAIFAFLKEWTQPA